MRASIRLISPLVAVLGGAAVARAQASPGCQEHFDSTFELIEQVVFVRGGCTSNTCHSGPLPAGGLDLSPGVAYDQLIDVPPQSVAAAQHPGLARVIPGNKGRSLLWLNLAAASQPELWRAPLRPMPQGGLPPLTFDELELVRMWIEYGATRDGVVPGTGDAFDACLPPPRPLKVEPLAPPPEGTGVQIRAPHQVLPPNSEREACFVSYYDVSGQVPEEFLSPDGTSFRYKSVDARQDPLSHHAVVMIYKGRAAIDDPVWGPFACRGGSRNGQACAPTDLDACGADGICASPPVQATGCIGFGPGDAGIGNGDASLFSTMASAVSGQEGIFEEAPLRGIMLWNSHAFNLTEEPADLDIWVNFSFASPAEQRRPLERFVDISAIYKMHAPAYGADQVCNHHVLPPAVRVLDVVSHTHKRGKRFEIFTGKFACDGGPNAGAPCSPLGPEPGFPLADPCRGAPCTSRQPPRAGDCNGDLEVSVDEVLSGVHMALEDRSMDACPRFDGDGSGTVSIDELVAALDAALQPRDRDPDASLFYTTLTYADPLVLNFDPPRSFGGSYATAAERTLTYCALYDNGFSNPDEVKRSSQVPTNGAPCRPTHCAAGKVGQPCSNDRQCDSAPKRGDGDCDACPVGFGVTTDDEMFVLAGSYVAD